MVHTTRRRLVGGIGLGASSLLSPAWAAAPDGHAAGLDVAAAPNPPNLIPRRTGDPIQFTASLDHAALKATSGGWAREITTRALPIATGLAVAHLYLNPGGAREMHWHNSAEWACVLDGHCQVTVQDMVGDTEVVNLGPGDLWYFPRGHAHAIQTLGADHCHAILAFDDGLYSEHGTFGLSDWMSRLEPAVLAQALGLPPAALDGIPGGETYIMQGPVIPLDSAQARAERVLPPDRTCRHRLLAGSPWAASAGGTIHLAGREHFPACASMTGQVTHLEPGAMQQLHWHPGANEMHYVALGRVRMTLFAPDKRLATAELVAGDCAYIPANCGHSMHNSGQNTCMVVSVQDAPVYEEGTLSLWLSEAPRHLLANGFGMAAADAPVFARRGPIMPKPG